MKQTHQQRRPRKRVRRSIYQAFSILIAGIIICLVILTVTGVFGSVFSSIHNAIPRFPSYGKLQTVNDYQSTRSVFDSQPKLSYNSNARYLFVEVSDYTCEKCAKFHGFDLTNPKNSSFNRIKEDFVKTGKMDYVFIDKQVLIDNDKRHNSTYCVAEQSTKKYFDYQENLWDFYGLPFNLESSKQNIDQLGFDEDKYDSCYNDKKYQDRVKNLWDFSSDTLKSTLTPTFYIFKVDKQNIVKLDGQKGTENVYTQIWMYSGDIDYDIFMKSKIEDVMNKNK